jgi:sugar phosphate isomerase/epimerase
MFKPAFSTVACPEWTLERAARAAAEWGYEGLEFRTFGHGSSQVACDPALTAAAKVRRMLEDVGVSACCLATGVRFDEPIRPPIIGRVIRDNEKSVRAAKAMIDLAAQIEAPLVRVFGFEFPASEPRRKAIARIVERLRLVVDGARNTGVKVVIENGGSFPRGADVAELIAAVGGSPLLGASYSAAVAYAAAEMPADGVRALGDRLWVAKIKDFRHGRACPLGTGEVPCARFVAALTESGFAGPLVYEWDRLWLPDLAPAETILPQAVQTMYAWGGGMRLAASR